MARDRVLVTGGNGGIGSGVMKRLEEGGYDPVSIDLTGPGINADLSDVDSVRAAVAEALEGGPIERIVNNVGGTNGAPLETVDEDDMDALWSVNVKAAVFATQALLPAMKSRGLGRVVNISSVAAYGKLEKTAYSSTKAAVLGLTKTWALELGRYGITVNAIAPGAIGDVALPSGQRDRRSCDPGGARLAADPADGAARGRCQHRRVSTR